MSESASAPISPQDETPGLFRQLATSVALSLWFVFVYTGANYLTSLRSDQGLAVFSWEHQIPFVPLMIIPYWSIDAFFFGAAFLLRTKTELRLFARRIWWLISISGVCFLLFPLQLAFQRPPVSGILGVLFGSLDQMYNFYNLAPSLHIGLRSLLWTVYITHTRGWLRVFLQIWFVLIGLSTLLCWQHHLIDVFTAQVLALLIIHLLPERAVPLSLPEPKRKINADRVISFYYFSGVLLLLFAVFQLPLWGIFLLWPAAALFVVGAAYAGLGPAVYRKHEGRVPMGTRVLLAPYFLGLTLSFLWFTRKTPPWVEIYPGIYVGQILSDHQAQALSRSGIRQILDLSAEWTEAQVLRAGEYKNIPVLDLTLPSEAQLRESRAILKTWSACGPIYVHCSLGRSRATLVVLNFLVLEGRVPSIEAGLKLLLEKRPSTSLSASKLEFLGTLTEHGSEV